MTDLLKALHLTRYIALDLETTGLEPKKDAIIEFAAVVFNNGEPGEKLTFLCDPGTAIDPEIELLTGITSAMVKGQKPFEEHLDAVQAFIGDLPLVAHNIGFDIGFLKSYFKSVSGGRPKALRNTLYDTFLLSAALYFYLPSHRLASVAEYCGFFSEDSHRAESDAVNTGRIFLCLIRELVKYDLETLQTINMVLRDTRDPNKWLYLNASKILQEKGNIGPAKADIDWDALPNVSGSKIKPDNMESAEESNKIESYFAAGGQIATQMPNYESRPQQIDMAETVYRCLRQENSAVIEAGTGVGKSLGYLIPEVLWLQQTASEKNRIVVASNTKTLQEQVFYKEIPFLQKNLKLNFKAVLLKGRNNYICLTRWHRLLSDLGNRVHITRRSAIIPIIIWLRHTKTGDISENSGFKLSANYALWRDICSEPGYCTTSVCRKYNGCYLGKIRHQAAQADINVVNHSLLLADAAADHTILPEYSAVVIDEAHNLEKNSYNYFASSVTLFRLNAILNRIYTQSPAERGVLVDILQLCTQIKKRHEIAGLVEQAKDRIGDADITATAFFKKIVTEKSAELRNRYHQYGLKKRFKDFSAEFPSLEIETNSFVIELSNIVGTLRNIIARTDELFADYPKLFDELRTQLSNSVTDLVDFRLTLETLYAAEDPDLVYWYEIGKSGREIHVQLSYTPLDVSGMLTEKIYEGRKSILLTSATLQIANSFDYMVRRTGMANLNKDALEIKAVGSPFDYSRQMKFITYHPEAGQINTLNEIAELIVKLATNYHKGILALFTSYSALSKVFARIQPQLQSAGVNLLAQGYGGSRSTMLDQFRRQRGSVLLGTDSFWEGIDLVGDVLQIVIITKLPFPVPSEPIIEANVEKYRLEGKNPFNDYYVPESILKFRQGIGRLVRSRHDTGVVLNFDDRIDKKQYGRFFKQSLPVQPESVAGRVQLFEVMDAFFSENAS